MDNRTRRKARRRSGPAAAPARHVTPAADTWETIARQLPDSSPVTRAAGVPLLAAALVASGAAAGPAAASPASSSRPARSPADTLLRSPLTAAATMSAATMSAPMASAPVTAGPVTAGPVTAAPVTVRAESAARLAGAFVNRAGAVYVVRAGDTVSAIAQRTGSTVAEIIRLNRLPASGLIHPGRRLVLAAAPVTSPPATTRPAVPAPAPAGPAAQYVVRAGDTVTDIATRHRITARAVIEANRLRADGLIRPGQRLVLPGVRPEPRATPAVTPAATRPYTVRAGDSLIAVCRAQKVSLPAVLRLNRLTRTSVIHPGQVLALPAPPARPTTPANTFLGRTYPDAVVRAAAANRAALAKRPMPTRAQVRALVEQTARRLGVDPALALAVAFQESGFNPRVVSPANAVGTMQVIPGTGRWASDLVGRPLDLLDPEDNVTAGVAVLAALLARAEEPQAIAGYYQGLGSVRSRGMFADTKRYVASVQAHRAAFAAVLDG